jgi:hypothetical protein
MNTIDERIETLNKLRYELTEVLEQRDVDEELGYDPLLNVINCQYLEITAYEEYEKLDEIIQVWEELIDIIKECDEVFDNVDHEFTPNTLLTYINGVQEECEKLQGYYVNRVSPQEEQFANFPKEISNEDIISLIRIGLNKVRKIQEKY